MVSVFKVTFTNSSFELSDLYERLSDIDKERISELSAVAFFDFDDNDRYIFFIIVDNIEMNSYSKILNDNLISHFVQDISSEVLNGTSDIEKYISKFVSPMNAIKFSFFIDDMNDWIYENLDIDMVLDRISQVGVGGLRNIEKEFLDNYSKVDKTKV